MTFRQVDIKISHLNSSFNDETAALIPSESPKGVASSSSYSSSSSVAPHVSPVFSGRASNSWEIVGQGEGDKKKKVTLDLQHLTLIDIEGIDALHLLGESVEILHDGNTYSPTSFKDQFDVSHLRRNIRAQQREQNTSFATDRPLSYGAFSDVAKSKLPKFNVKVERKHNLLDEE